MGYTIHVDGKLLYSTESEDISQIVLNPKLELDTNGAGSLSFVIPPSHEMHGGIKRLKSIVTVEQNGDELFRGRMVDSESDCFNQETVTCEGEKSFLLDSLYEADTFNGNAQELFRRLIDNHNSQVEESKRFSVGSITAVDSNSVVDEEVRVETRKFWDTQTVINDRLLNVYGGYLRTRKNGNARIIDWLKEYGGENSQEIKFAVNLLDLKNKISGEDVFTVLIPLGYSEMGSDGSYTDPVNIASVNGGREYIQDDAAVALYGKIWRTKTWGQTKEPSKLLEKAREYLKTGIAFQSITLNAVDMHIIDDDISRIKVGDKVHIVSDPNGIDLWLVCIKIVIDLLNPEKSEYTFGEKPRTLSEGIARTERDVDELSGRGGGGGRRSIADENQDILRWAKISADQANAQILLSAGEINKLTNRTSTAEIAIDGLNAAVITKASIETVDALTGRVSTAEATLTVQAEQISSKVSKDGVISSINQTAESITIQANKVNLSGYVTASQLSAEIAEIDKFFSGVAEASVLKSTMVNCTGTLMYKDDAISKSALKMGSITTTESALVTGTIDLSHSHAVTVSDDGTVTLGGAQAEGGNFRIADTKAYKDGVSAAANGVTISRGSWSGGVLRPSTSTGKSVDIQLTASQAWSGNKCTVTINDAMGTNGSQTVSTGYSTVVDATSLVSAAKTSGANGVTISSYSGWQSSGVNTVTLSNGKTGNVSLPSFSFSSGSWSSGSRTVSVYWRDNNGTNHTAKSVTVSIPDISITWSNPQQGYAKVTVTCGGKSVTSSKNISGYT